jgi:hypothetical protein
MDIRLTAVPPSPVQFNEKVLDSVSGPTVSLPLTALIPLQSPLAVQLEASVDVQLNWVVLPLSTKVSAAVNVTVGCSAGATCTVTLAASEPTLFEQTIPNNVSSVSADVVWVPEVDREPDQPPFAMQLSALLAFHVMLVVSPAVTLLGVAEILTLGKATAATNALDETLPPTPAQFSVYTASALRAPVLSLPLDALVPDHAPDAVQLAALVLFQVRTVDEPTAIFVSAACRLKVGGGTVLTVAVTLALPPGPEQVSVKLASWLRFPVLALPLTALTPDQAPDAIQLSVSVELHVNTVADPAAMEDCAGCNVTVGAFGAGSTCTVVLALTVPPGPVQLSAK